MVTKVPSAKLGNHLEIKFDNWLTFNQNVCSLYDIVSNKLHATSRVPSDMNQDKKRLLSNLCL